MTGLHKRLTYTLLHEPSPGWFQTWCKLPSHRNDISRSHIREKGKKAYVALLDTRKAFNTVWHDGLFHKLASPHTLPWLATLTSTHAPHTKQCHIHLPHTHPHPTHRSHTKYPHHPSPANSPLALGKLGRLVVDIWSSELLYNLTLTHNLGHSKSIREIIMLE